MLKTSRNPLLSFTCLLILGCSESAEYPPSPNEEAITDTARAIHERREAQRTRAAAAAAARAAEAAGVEFTKWIRLFKPDIVIAGTGPHIYGGAVAYPSTEAPPKRRWVP